MIDSGPGTRRSNRRLIVKLVVVVTIMLGFSYAFVPFYNRLCQAIGLNGKTERISRTAAAAEPVDPNRWVTVQFLANTNAGMPWDFKTKKFELRVHPGQVASVRYYARNPTTRIIVGRAVSSVTPIQAAAHFKKIQCFCFSNQRLGPGQTRVLPVQFVVDKGLPQQIHTITLSYTFFNVTGASKHHRGKASNGRQTQHDPGAGTAPPLS